MIATILPGSSNFHAVGYNERKVSQGKARLLEMKNFGPVGKFGPYTVGELVSYLKQYSARNDRIRKPQFHVAISCKGHELSEQQLLDFAHDYLREMGYADEGQPLLIYSHYDTANTHIHIVTSRIAPDGRKIDHNNERRRSQAILNRLLGQNMKDDALRAIDKAKEYSFTKLTQFKTVLGTMGYEVYDKDDTIYVKKGGWIQAKIPLVEIEALFQTERKRDRKREKQLKAIFLKYINICNNRQELQDIIKKKLGIDLVFYGKADSPYGYAIVDHANKIVIPGNAVLGLKDLLDFSTPEEKMQRVDEFITKILDADPGIRTSDINRKIMGQGYLLKGDVLYYQGKKHFLHPDVAKRININDRVYIVNCFLPSDEAERAALCSMYKIEDHIDDVEISNTVSNDRDDIIDTMRNLFQQHSGRDLRAALRGENIIIKRHDDNSFAVDVKSRVIVNLDANGFDTGRLWPPRRPRQNRDNRVRKGSGARVGGKDISGKNTPKDIRVGQGQNREWEVGSREREDKIDDHIDKGVSY